MVNQFFTQLPTRSAFAVAVGHIAGKIEKLGKLLWM